MQAVADSVPDSVIIGADISNAFNTRSRQAIWDALRASEHCRPLLRYFQFAYGHPTPLRVYNRPGNCVAVLQSAEGVRQGDPLGSLLYALSVQKMYERVADRHKGVALKAIADDLHIAGPWKASLTCWDDYRDTCRADGLNVAPEKGFALWPHDSPVPEALKAELRRRGIAPCEKVAPVLGAFVGHVDCIAYTVLLQQYEADSERLFQALMDTRLPTVAALRIARQSYIAAFGFLLRTLMPASEHTQGFLRNIDQKMRDFVRRRIGFAPDLSSGAQAATAATARMEMAERQMKLPVRHGGLGLPSLQIISPVAHVSALAAAIPDVEALAKHFPSIGDSAVAKLRAKIEDCLGRFGASSLAAAHQQQQLSLSRQQQSQRRRSPALLPDCFSTLRAWAHTKPERRTIKHLQREFTQQLHKELAQGLLSAATSREDQVRLASVSCKYAGAWLTGPLEDQRMRLTNSEASYAIRHRLGLPPSDDLLDCPFCESKVNGGHNRAFVADPNHLQLCDKARGGVDRRHKHVCDALGMVANALQFFDDGEPRVGQHGGRQRLDLDLRGSGITSGEFFSIDVSLVHPTAHAGPERRRTTPLPRLGRPSPQIVEREKEKHLKYDALAAARGHVMHAFVMDSYGVFSKEATALLRELNSIAVLESVKDVPRPFLQWARCMLSVAAQRGNAMMADACANHRLLPASFGDC